MESIAAFFNEEYTAQEVQFCFLRQCAMVSHSLAEQHIIVLPFADMVNRQQKHKCTFKMTDCAPPLLAKYW